ncbi:hypothetical protein A3K55_02130 [Candidatus Shapirobacteria bacterium RBG_13_44_7]|uniref:Uncharacterized protein n=1 Tax=Candidatus Shapirobacteria bacterium RBG_13_44_7 TaxID=1802149 RepID=A0A1F7SGH1_9BACT|nr:MAG: hypothetical protein A3K55_02130 [Candidatus Shapirobacteria bacterium RBG_13_44_7]
MVTSQRDATAERLSVSPDLLPNIVSLLNGAAEKAVIYPLEPGTSRDEAVEILRRGQQVVGGIQPERFNVNGQSITGAISTVGEESVEWSGGYTVDDVNLNRRLQMDFQNVGVGEVSGFQLVEFMNPEHGSRVYEMRISRNNGGEIREPTTVVVRVPEAI